MNFSITGLAVAEALRELGRLIEARDKALAVTRIAERDQEPEPFTQARRQARELSVALAPLIPSIRVEVLTRATDEPIDDATVRLDGESMEAAELQLPRKLNPGQHTVAATAVGYDTAVKTIELGEGEHHFVSLALRGGDRAGPLTIAELSPLVWIGFGTTVAGAIVGSATGSAALAKSAALESDCIEQQCPAGKQGTIDSMNRLSHVSTVSFALAGAGAALGTVGVVLSLASSSPESGQARLSLGIGAGFVGVAGQF